MGKTEMFFIRTLEEEVKKKELDRFFSYPIPALVVANEMDVDDTIIFTQKNIKDRFLKQMLKLQD